MRQSVYIETSVVSYYVSRPARDVVVLGHQETTRVWWEQRLPRFRPFVSPAVIEEARAGDADHAKRRLDAIAAFEVLAVCPEVEQLAARYTKQLGLPLRAIRDAAHMAFASVYGLDYLVTWNCAHIANAEVIRSVTSINLAEGLPIPVICTPEELMGGEYDPSEA